MKMKKKSYKRKDGIKLIKITKDGDRTGIEIRGNYINGLAAIMVNVLNNRNEIRDMINMLDDVEKEEEV